MQSQKKTADDKLQRYRGINGVGVHQQHAQKTARRDDTRSVTHDLAWVPSANEHMLIL
ncbi:hypothetical protein D3C85_1541950 [compost metagenome]